MKLLTTASAIALLSATAAFGQDATAVPGDAEADASSFAFIGDVDRNASASTTGSTAQAAIETAFPGAALPIIGIERAAASAGDGIEVDVNGNPVGGGSSGTLNLASSGPANAQLQFQLGNLNTALNTQVGTDQQSATVQIGNENTAFIAQTDEGNRAALSQVGNDNFSGLAQDGVGNAAVAAVFGNDNLVWGTQVGDDNVQAHAQAGNDNQSVTYQDGTLNVAASLQFGDDNESYINQGGPDLMVSLLGVDGNTYGGVGIPGGATVSGALGSQGATNNAAASLQLGTDNRSAIFQSGNSNSAVNYQDSSL